MEYLTLEMAKKRARLPLTSTHEDDVLLGYLEEAQAIVLAYLQTTKADTPPPDDRIRNAIGLQFAELWRFRGNDPEGVAPAPRIAGAPSPAIERALFGRRLPTIA